MKEDSVAAQHAMEKRSACAPISVDEGMDGFELGMDEGGFGDRVYPFGLRESAKVVQALIDAAWHRWHKQCTVGTVGGTADPNLLTAQLSCKIKSGFLDQLAMNLPNAVGREGVFEIERASHGIDVPRNDECVWRRGGRKLRQSDIARAGGEVFYLGACRRFTAQQEAGKVKGQRVLVLVESDEAHSGISEALGELG